jgi:VWFA-related protein
MEGASVSGRVSALVVSAVLAALVLPIHSQHEQPPRSIFRVRTDLIPVDVSVLDNDRQPVRGLTAADFAVYEDGKRREIVAFSAVDVPGPVRDATVAPWVRDAPRDVVSNDLPDEGRLVVILMDGTIPDGQPTIAAKQIAHAAVDELGPGDLAAVVRSTIFSNNGLSQGFTSDRSKLIEAIDSPFMGTTEPSEMTAAGLESPSPVPGSAVHTKEQCEVLYDVARAMRDAPRRRKVVIFVGTSLGLSGQLRSGGDIRFCREELLGELAESNVTIQVVDPVGLLTGAVAADYTTHERVMPELQQRWARQNQGRIDALRVLPGLTGGRLVANTNTPQNVMPAIFAESQSYYLLGFEPASPATKDAHTIRVDVRRRGVTVHWRNGYRTQPDENAATARETRGDAGSSPPELTAALDGALPHQDLPLSVTAAPFALATGRNAAIAIALGATWPTTSGSRTLDVTVGAFDVRGNSVGVGHQTIEVPAELARAGRADEGLITRLDLPRPLRAARGGEGRCDGHDRQRVLLRRRAGFLRWSVDDVRSAAASRAGTGGRGQPDRLCRAGRADRRTRVHARRWGPRVSADLSVARFASRHRDDARDRHSESDRRRTAERSERGRISRAFGRRRRPAAAEPARAWTVPVDD